MKIGTSLGKCVRSILAGEVKEEDVLFIVTQTKCPNIESLMEVIDEYYYTYQGAAGRVSDYDMSKYSLADACSVAQRLFESGKLHQPRVVATGLWSHSNGHDLKDTWYDIMPSPVLDSESVREAWNHYTMIRSLAA
jgi:hypothetical protein